MVIAGATKVAWIALVIEPMATLPTLTGCTYSPDRSPRKHHD